MEMLEEDFDRQLSWLFVKR